MSIDLISDPMKFTSLALWGKVDNLTCFWENRPSLRGKLNPIFMIQLVPLYLLSPHSAVEHPFKMQIWRLRFPAQISLTASHHRKNKTWSYNLWAPQRDRILATCLGHFHLNHSAVFQVPGLFWCGWLAAKRLHACNCRLQHKIWFLTYYKNN